MEVLEVRVIFNNSGFNSGVQSSDRVTKQFTEGTLGALEIKLKQLQQELKNTVIGSASFAALSNQIAQVKTQMLSATGAMGSTNQMASQMGMTMLNLNYVVRDSPYLFFNLAMGIMAIGNNMNPLIDSMKRSVDAAGGFKGFIKEMGTYLGKGGWFTLGMSLAVTAFQAVTFAMSKTSKEAKDAKFNIDEFTKSIDGNISAVKELNKELSNISYYDLINKIHDVKQVAIEATQELQKEAETSAAMMNQTFMWGIPSALGMDFFSAKKQTSEQQTQVDRVVEQNKKIAESRKELFTFGLKGGESPNDLRKYLNDLEWVLNDWALNVKKKQITVGDVVIGEFDRGTLEALQKEIQDKIGKAKQKKPAKISDAEFEKMKDWYAGGIITTKEYKEFLDKRLSERKALLTKGTDEERNLYLEYVSAIQDIYAKGGTKTWKEAANQLAEKIKKDADAWAEEIRKQQERIRRIRLDFQTEMEAAKENPFESKETKEERRIQKKYGGVISQDEINQLKIFTRQQDAAIEKLQIFKSIANQVGSTLSNAIMQGTLAFDKLLESIAATIIQMMVVKWITNLLFPSPTSFMPTVGSGMGAGMLMGIQGLPMMPKASTIAGLGKFGSFRKNTLNVNVTGQMKANRKDFYLDIQQTESDYNRQNKGIKLDRS